MAPTATGSKAGCRSHSRNSSTPPPCGKGKVCHTPPPKKDRIGRCSSRGPWARRWNCLWRIWPVLRQIIRLPFQLTPRYQIATAWWDARTCVNNLNRVARHTTSRRPGFEPASYWWRGESSTLLYSNSHSATEPSLSDPRSATVNLIIHELDRLPLKLRLRHKRWKFDHHH